MKRLIAVVGTFASVCILCMSGYAGAVAHVTSHATPALVDEINANLDVFGTVESDKTSGTSEYNLYFGPDGSLAGDLGRTDMIHIGGTNNCHTATNPVVGTYVSLGRAAMYPTDAKYPGGNFDTGLRVDALNRATNETTMGLRGAHIKAKSYSGAIVGGLEGMFLECIGDGTEDNGEAVGLKIGTDSSTIDYGIDMDLMTADVADIRFQNGATVLNTDAGTLTFTEATNSFVGTVTCTPGGTYTQVMNSGTAFTNVYNQAGWLISHNP